MSEDFSRGLDWMSPQERWILVGHKEHDRSTDRRNSGSNRGQTTKVRWCVSPRLWWLLYMTSAKLLPPPTCHVQNSRNLVPFVYFLGNPHPLRTSYMEAPFAIFSPPEFCESCTIKTANKEENSIKSKMTTLRECDYWMTRGVLLYWPYSTNSSRRI